MFLLGVVVIEVAVGASGEGSPHQAVANAVAAAERVLWLHIPKTGGTTLALVAMKAALKKEGKIAVCARSHNPHACLDPRHILSSCPSFCTTLPRRLSITHHAASLCDFMRCHVRRM